MRSIWLSIFLVSATLVITQSLFAETYFVDQNHPLANDNNPGTESEPFETVRKGINKAAATDTVFIKVGLYNMSGFSKDMDQPITIIGQDQYSTVLDSMGTFNIISSSYANLFTLENLMFTNYIGTVFNLTVADGDTIDGVEIANCTFDKIENSSKTRLFLARYDVDPGGIITNVNISLINIWLTDHASTPQTL